MMAESAQHDVEELEGDVDIDDFGAWLMNDEVSNEDEIDRGKQNPKEEVPISVKKDKENEQSPSRLPEKVPSVSPKRDVPSDSQTDNNASTTESGPVSKSKPPVSSKNSVSNRGSQKNIFSDIGDIAGLIDCIDSPQNFVKKTSVKKDENIEPKKKDNLLKSENVETAKKETLVKTKGLEIAHKDHLLKSENLESITDSVTKLSNLKVAESTEKCVQPEPDSPVKDSAKREDSNDKRTPRHKEVKSTSGTPDKSKSPANEDDEIVMVTEKEMREVDDFLSNNMFKSINKSISSTTGLKVTVTISPMEIADLAEQAVQDLIKSQPSIAFCFKKQAVKFKKKKGYAELVFNRLGTVSSFLTNFVASKFLSRQLELTFLVESTKTAMMKGSFKIDMAKADKLVKVISNGQYPTQPRKKVNLVNHFVVENLPENASFVYCKILFPFSSFVEIERKSKDQEKSNRVAEVYYSEQQCLDAFLECCSNFTYNDHQLTTIKVETGKKEETEEKKALEKFHTVNEKEKMKEEVEEPGTDLGTEERSEDQSEPTGSTSDADASIANMTLDVCSTMMESLNKLKELESDDPNVQKILEMQAQLAKLQNSLLGKETSSSDDSVERETPLSPTEVQSSSTQENMDDSSSKTAEVDIKEELTEIERAEQILWAQEEEEQRQIEKLKQLKEEQRLEQEKWRKSTWAKKLIEESKDTWTSLDEVKSKPLTEDAQKLLRLREEKLAKEKEMEENTTTTTEQMETKEEEEEERKKLEAVEEEKRQKELKEEEERKNREEEEQRKKEEEDKRRKEQELKAQQKLREELERAAQKQSESSNTGRLKSILQTFQETFSSLSKSLPENTADQRGTTQEDIDEQKASDANLSEGSSQQLASKRDSTDAGLDESNTAAKLPKLDEERRMMSEQDYTVEFGHLSVEQRPKNIQVQIEYYKGRRCPVESCPTSASKVYLFQNSFSDHWKTFHKPNMTVKFCQKCSAYFSQEQDLRNHLLKLHDITDSSISDKLVSEARTKIVTNPSFRDPWPYVVS